MKKRMILGGTLAAAMLTASALTTFAAEPQSGTTTLTVQKAASYMLHIPQDQEITFGTMDTEIGTLSVTGEIGANQKVNVNVTKTGFIDTEDAGNKFSFELREGNAEFQGKEWGSQELKDNKASAALTVHIPSETWGSTEPATYKATVTFQASLTDRN
ncbi:MAG: cation transporter [Eubacteriales bacterium]|nr:cation transporter [Eubacteriales bacterium]